MSLVFYGGDPLVSRSKLLALIKFCRRQGFKRKIFIVTNGTCIDEAWIKLFARYKIHPVIPFMGEKNNSLIALEKLTYLTQSFHKKKIEFTLTLVIDSENVNEALEMENLTKNLGAKSILKTVILDNDESKSMETLRILGKQMIRITPDVFYHNMENHPCLDGTLAVSAEGNLLPCPSLKDEIFGNITYPRCIDEIFESRIIDKYWGLTLSQIERCKECEFRFGCLDCRAVEKTLTGSLYGKKLCQI